MIPPARHGVAIGRCLDHPNFLGIANISSQYTDVPYFFDQQRPWRKYSIIFLMRIEVAKRPGCLGHSFFIPFSTASAHSISVLAAALIGGVTIDVALLALLAEPVRRVVEAGGIPFPNPVGLPPPSTPQEHSHGG